MSDDRKTTGIGIFGMVFLIFLVLKLTGIGIVAGWSWWWVTSPLWMPFSIFIVIAAICAVIAIIKELR